VEQNIYISGYGWFYVQFETAGWNIHATPSGSFHKFVIEVFREIMPTIIKLRGTEGAKA